MCQRDRRGAPPCRQPMWVAIALSDVALANWRICSTREMQTTASVARPAPACLARPAAAKLQVQKLTDLGSAVLMALLPVSKSCSLSAPQLL